MKNVFGVNLRTGAHDGEQFIVRRAEGELAAKQAKLERERAEFERFAGLPVWVNVCGAVLLFLGLIFLCGILEGLDEIGIKQAWRNAGWCFIVAAVCIVAAAAIFTAAAVKRRRALAAPVFRSLKVLTERVEKESYEAFGVPSSACKIDVLSYLYRRKEGKKVKENDRSGSYANADVRAYCENDALCLAFTDCVFAIPLSRISSIQCIGKRIAAAGWNKEEPVRRGRYRNYKVGNDNAGRVITKPYYRMTVRDGLGEEYEVLIPCYDIDAILSLTGKTVG